MIAERDAIIEAAAAQRRVGVPTTVMHATDPDGMRVGLATGRIGENAMRARNSKGSPDPCRIGSGTLVGTTTLLSRRSDDSTALVGKPVLALTVDLVCTALPTSENVVCSNRFGNFQWPPDQTPPLSWVL